MLTWSYLVPVNAFMLLVPHPLLCDWGHDTIPLIKSLFDTRNIITLSFLVSLAVFTYAILQTTLRSRARSPAIFISVGWAAITFLPASNLFFPVGFVVADRVLYTPTMGSCMLLAHAACVLRDKRRLQQPRLMSVLSSLLLLLLLLLPVAYFARTWLRQFFSPSAPPIHPCLTPPLRNIDWQNGVNLWTSALRCIVPHGGERSTFCHSFAGSTLAIPSFGWGWRMRKARRALRAWRR